MKLLLETIEGIGKLNQEAMEQARHRVDNLIKPPGSLGRIEELAVQLSGITGDLYPKVDKKLIIVMSADHGVYQEGVAPNPQVITAIQTPNFVKGVTGVCAFAKLNSAEVIVVDIGINGYMDADGVINRKIAYGTKNMAVGPAMTREEAIKSIEIGIDITQKEIKKGVNLVGTGEMGIGNTTASSAILSVIGELEPYLVTGMGAGLPKEKIKHKAEVIKRAIEINKPNKEDGIDILAKVGGFEIGGMAGIILGAAANRIPVVIDGFISNAAALIAYKLQPRCKEFMIASHSSAEKGGEKALEILGLKPLLNLDLRLGEGSGAALAFNLVEAATYMVKEMVTLEESGIIL